MSIDEQLVKARQFADKLRSSLPPSVSAAALGVRSKAPFKLLCVREALIWRTEELARNACDALARDDLTVAALLARAIVESAALAWKLMELLEDRNKLSSDEMDEHLMRLLLGTQQWTDFPRPFRIGSLLKQMEKKELGAQAAYNRLSEIAHPNWIGVSGLYSRNDTEKLVTYFGRGLGAAAATKIDIAVVMLDALGVFEDVYNRISEVMPSFLAELESIGPAEQETKEPQETQTG